MRNSLKLIFLFQMFQWLPLGIWGQADRSSSSDSQGASVWHFAVSGDSRNCGDVVMPAIAQRVEQDGAAFYWHLGDYRAIYDFDQDFKSRHPNSTVLQYESSSWPDFIEQQLVPFGDLPVYLGLGNHETISPKRRSEAVLQFADWLDTPELRSQRLRDDPKDHLVRFYYHWIRGPVDFINLDNASQDEFDDSQMDWLARQLE